MAAFGDITGLIFQAFCSLGCGGDVGLTFIGIFALVVFVVLMFILKMGLDGVLVAGGFFVILLSQEGYIFSWLGSLVWVIAGILWVSIIWRYVRS